MFPIRELDEKVGGGQSFLNLNRFFLFFNGQQVVSSLVPKMCPVACKLMRK